MSKKFFPQCIFMIFTCLSPSFIKSFQIFSQSSTASCLVSPSHCSIHLLGHCEVYWKVYTLQSAYSYCSYCYLPHLVVQETKLQKYYKKGVYSNIAPWRKGKLAGFSTLPGAQSFFFPPLRLITLSVVYGMLTKQHTLKIELDASKPSGAWELNSPLHQHCLCFSPHWTREEKHEADTVCSQLVLPAGSSCHLLWGLVGKQVRRKRGGKGAITMLELCQEPSEIRHSSAITIL